LLFLLFVDFVKLLVWLMLSAPVCIGNLRPVGNQIAIIALANNARRLPSAQACLAGFVESVEESAGVACFLISHWVFLLLSARDTRGRGLRLQRNSFCRILHFFER